MYGEIHILTGIILQQAVGTDGLPFAIAAAIGSHPIIDDLNVGQYYIYHALGSGWRKYALIGARIGLGTLLAYYLWYHPQYLLCGLLAWLPWDIDHVIPGKYKHWVHYHMFPKWLQSKWGLLINLTIIVVLLGTVIW